MPYALSSFTGSFAGMTSESRIKNFYEFIILGLIVGICFILMQGVLIGVGGRLGFIAFISTLAYVKVIKVIFRNNKLDFKLSNYGKN